MQAQSMDPWAPNMLFLSRMLHSCATTEINHTGLGEKTAWPIPFRPDLFARKLTRSPSLSKALLYAGLQSGLLLSLVINSLLLAAVPSPVLLQKSSQ